MKLLRPLTVALVLSLSLAAAGCGGDDDSVSSEEAAQQAKDAAEDARQEAELDALRKEVEGSDDDEDSGDSSAPPAATTTSSGSTAQGDDCGGGVRAGPNTSCPFALNVAAEYRSSGGGTRISVYSPTTGETYRMSCSEGSPNVCTGGNNASVYIP